MYLHGQESHNLHCAFYRISITTKQAVVGVEL